ncbi:MAG: metal ABC transporter ATP-binding protein [Saprospirales bacterium]|nr:MAG: metal ABC transporter ATP-binding protein [Saprospirales bacterium]
MEDKKTIEIKGLSVNYGKRRILTNIYLDIFPGKIYGLVGPNGAGKSTLFHAILQLTESISGEIKIFNHPLNKVRSKIAYIPQKDDIDWSFPTTVEEVVLQGRYPYKRVGSLLSKEDYGIASEAMKKLNIEQLAKRQISKLSGGQQQRVFIARALCQQADIFLLDEPFTGVDHLSEVSIVGVLKSLREEGKTILVVHHDLSTVKSYFDHVILLNQRLIAEGSVEDTFTVENLQHTFGPQLTVFQKAGLG